MKMTRTPEIVVRSTVRDFLEGKREGREVLREEIFALF